MLATTRNAPYNQKKKNNKPIINSSLHDSKIFDDYCATFLAILLKTRRAHFLPLKETNIQGNTAGNVLKITSALEMTSGLKGHPIIASGLI